MFFLMELDKTILLPPRAFGPNLTTTIRQKLRQEVRILSGRGYFL